ncbi:MAG TPA: phospholipase D-like domain-containing protein [Chlamydiales bacterium]|nr:phospholipase D-like domain-containing protein [Chlamydiales bacterium]
MTIYSFSQDNRIISIPTPPIEVGFGEHQFTDGQILAYKVHSIVCAVLYGLVAAGAIVLSVSTSAFFIPVALLFIFLAVRSSLYARGYANVAPSTENLFNKGQIDLLPRMGELDNDDYSGIATRDSTDGYQWKMELIRIAEKSIVMSGCYCGGKPFDEMLDLIGDRMKANQELTVSLIFSTSYLTKENENRIDLLRKTYPERFKAVDHVEVFPTAMHGLSITANHTKVLIIDYGQYFMIGGSGVVGTWTNHPAGTTPIGVNKQNLVGIVGPSGFRDMDFVFHSPKPFGMGARLYAEMEKLIFRMSPQELGSARSIPFHQTKKTPFHFEKNKTKDLKIAYFATGPEQKKNPYHEEIVNEVRNAKKSIVISNMYFHPSQELQQALIDASNRGVKIQVICNSFNLSSPYLHYTFVELSKYYMRALYEGRVKPNVEIYEYDLSDVTLHKKVFVFDEERVLTGSANIGYKSLEGKGDYELNLAIHSKEFAASVMESMKEDMRIATMVPLESAPSISLQTRVLSTLQFPLKYVAF